MKALTIGILASIAAPVAPECHAGFVITSNLPNGSAIIGISGTADGAASFSGPGQDDWYQPFNTSNQLVEYTFQPGTYSFRVINSTDAASLFPSLTTAQLSQIGPSGWTFNSPWITQYMAWDSSAATNSTEHQLFAGSVSPNTFSNAAQAYADAIAGGYFDTIVTGSGRNTGTVQSSYTFTSTETLIFAIPDYFLPDNGGLVSVLVTPLSVPEPSSWLMLGIGSIGLGLARVSRARRPGR